MFDEIITGGSALTLSQLIYDKELQNRRNKARVQDV